MAVWQRNDVELGDLFTRADFVDEAVSGRNGAPVLMRVVGICDNPTLILRPVGDPDGDLDEHYVISSPLFAEFKKVEARGPA